MKTKRLINNNTKVLFDRKEEFTIVGKNEPLLDTIIDETTKEKSSACSPADIRCFEKGCRGTTRIELLSSTNEIHWMCSRCDNEGKISHWQGTKWDNGKII